MCLCSFCLILMFDGVVKAHLPLFVELLRILCGSSYGILGVNRISVNKILVF